MALVVFDLDGTITRRDTFAAYLAGFLGRHRSRWPRLLASVPALIGAAVGLVGRGPLKASLMRAALGGYPRSALDAWTQIYVTELLAHGVFADARAAIAQHLNQGDELVLMSASPDLYVPEIARRLGFRETICTGVLWRGDRLDGALTTPNRRGAEKARCLRKLRSRHPDLAAVAYANSACDFEHMRLADQAYLINASARLRRQAEALKFHCLCWR